MTSALSSGWSIFIVYLSDNHFSSWRHEVGGDCGLPLNRILLMTIPKLGAVIKSLTAVEIIIIIKPCFNYRAEKKRFVLGEKKKEIIFSLTYVVAQIGQFAYGVNCVQRVTAE